MRDREKFIERLADLMNVVPDERRTTAESIMDDVRADYEDAMGWLEKLGKIEDGNFTASDDYSTNWREKYNAEKERYRKRWMNGVDTIQESEETDIDPSGADEVKIRSYEELLGREEGDD